MPVCRGLTPGGDYRVEINGVVLSDRKMANPRNPNAPPFEFYDNPVPPEYNAQSTLQVTVPAASQGEKHDFDLKSR